MGQQSYPYDAGTGAAVNEGQWQAMARRFLATGVITGSLNQVLVSADGSALSVSVATGDAFVEGFFYRNDAALALTIATANATNPRLDTVVVRLDRTANTAVLAVVTGTPAAGPVAPTLSATDTLFDLPLANVLVPAAAGVIVAGNVTDRRVLVKNLTEAAASAAYEPLQIIGEVAIGAGGGSILFSGIPATFRQLRLEVIARGSRVATDDQMILRFNGDSAANYDWQTLVASAATISASEAIGAGFIETASIPAASSPASAFAGVSIDVYGYVSAVHKSVVSRSGARRTATSGGLQAGLRHGLWRNTAAITQILLGGANASLADGTTARLYGMKGA